QRIAQLEAVTEVAVVAEDRGNADAGTRRAGVAGRAQVGVVAGQRVVDEGAAHGRAARIVGAGVAVVADERPGRRQAGAGQRVAALGPVAEIAVLTVDRGTGLAADGRIAGLDAVAGVAVVAGGRRAREASARG